MYDQRVQFETPENVQIHYPVAGAGTRFVAWLLDQMIVWAVSELIEVSLLSI